MSPLSHPLALFSYGFLYLTVISLWFPRKSFLKIWYVLLVTAIALGILSQQMELIAAIPVTLLPIAIYYSEREKTPAGVRIFAFICIILFSVGLAAHLFPGFYNLKVFDQVYFSQDAIPFALYLNFDKALIGVFILGISHQLIYSRQDWVKLFKIMIPQMLVTIFIVVLLALVLKFVRFDPKLPQGWLIWVVTNLLFVSVAEEAFFRGFLQKRLSLIMKKVVFGNYLAILIAALLFGLAHYAGGVKYVLLATVAGVGYGLIYDRTKRIEASISTHFGVNLSHFLLFTYPMLVVAQ